MRRAIKKYCLSITFLTTVHGTTINVTSLEDSGKGTLRNAILLAHNSDIIQFAIEQPGTIMLQSSLPPISQSNLSIFGQSDESGKNEIVIASTLGFAVFDILGDYLTVSDLNLLYDHNTPQGGLVNLHTAKNATFANMHIASELSEPGIYPIAIMSDGTLNLINVIFDQSVITQFYIDGGSLNITETGSATYIVDGINEANLQKFGNGIVTIKSPDDTTPLYFLSLQNGTLDLRGVFDGSAYVIQGLLQGNCTLDEINSIGIVMPGDVETIGQLTTTGNFNALSGGAIQIKLCSSGLCDILNVVGNATLAGTLSLLPLDNLEDYRIGTVYQIITTEGVVNGTFIEINTGGLAIEINYLQQGVSIKIIE